MVDQGCGGSENHPQELHPGEEPISEGDTAPIEYAASSEILLTEFLVSHRQAAALPETTAAVTTDQVFQQLVDIQLVESEYLQQLRGRTLPQTPADVVLAQLIEQGTLTAYQSVILADGDGDSLLLGDYLIEEQLEPGGTAILFKARHRGTRELCAIKVLSVQSDGEVAADTAFRREVHLAMNLDHPNIVKTFRGCQDKGMRYIVMEFLDGEDLDRRVQRLGPLPIDEALDSVWQAAQALEYAHGNSVVHRDIKPMNLMRTNSSGIKLLDLGLARQGRMGAGQSGSDLGNEQDKTVWGSVDYISPERCLKEDRSDHRTDIFSLGCTLYFLLTGKTAIAGKNAEEKLRRLRDKSKTPARTLDRVRSDLPAQLLAIHERMVRRSPDDRYSTATLLRQELEKCRAEP